MTSVTYENAYMNLNCAFAERGLTGSVKTAVADQKRAELRSRLENPGAYILDDIMESDRASKYRTGFADGNSYMTVDDLMRLYEDENIRRTDRRSCVLPLIDSERAERSMRFDRRPAHAYGVHTAHPMPGGSVKPLKGMKLETVYSGNRSAEMSVECREKGFLKRTVEGVKRLSDNVYTVKEGRNLRRTPAAIAAFSLCFVFILVLALPITLSIMINNESTELGTLQDSLRSKTAEVKSLEIELDERNDRLKLEDLAVNKYGMIELNLSAYKAMTVNAEDKVEVADTGSENTVGAFQALMSALGLRRSEN